MFPRALELQSLPTSVEVCRPEWGDVSQKLCFFGVFFLMLLFTVFAPSAVAYCGLKWSQCEVTRAELTGFICCWGFLIEAGGGIFFFQD